MQTFKSWLENDDDWKVNFDKEQNRQKEEAAKLAEAIQTHLLPLATGLNSAADINVVLQICQKMQQEIEKINNQFQYGLISTHEISENLQNVVMMAEMIQSGQRKFEHLKSFVSRLIAAITGEY